ncbi:MAG: hypothetical protein WKF88_05905 [Ferruginibacter sp.]
MSAQQLTGTWEGDILDENEFLQINIVQVGDKLCGYTWDYIYNNRKSFCKAYFTGSYDKEKKRWFLDGSSFMENSGSHSLMQLLVSVTYEDLKPVMTGYCRIKPEGFFSIGGSPSPIRLRRVSPQPDMLTEVMKNCIAENQPPKKIKPQKPSVPKKEPVRPLPPPPVKKVPVPKPDTAPVIVPPPPVAKVIPPDTKVKPPVASVLPPETLPVKTLGRVNKEIRRIPVKQKKLHLEIYDNAEVDGDTISVFYNGRVIMSHRRLTGKAIVVDLTLDENTTLHSIGLFAENLGSLPPNTALIIFTDAAGKRYELFARTDFDQNAVLVFEYKPD